MNITKEQYVAQNSKSEPTVNHFYEKLLKLKGLMKTDAGKRRRVSNRNSPALCHMRLLASQSGGSSRIHGAVPGALV